MKYQEIREQFIWNVRLDFDPVGIRFVYDDDEFPRLPVTHTSKAKLTYCQYLTAVRQKRLALFLKPEKLLCQNAALVFGFRDIDEKLDTKQHLKYLMDESLALAAAREKVKLKKGCRGIYMAPLDFFDKIPFRPDMVFMVCTPYQAYHLLNDYMGATQKPNLTFRHTPNSAVCSGSVWAFTETTANMTTICAGSKTSGKTEMGYVNLFIPGEHIIATALQQKKRCDLGEGASLMGEGSEPWPGLDVCKGCPMFKFEKLDQ